MSPTVSGTGLSPADVAAIRAIREPWTKACLQRDWDRLLSMCTDDIVFLPPNEPVVQGSGVRSWLNNFPTIKTMEWDIDHVEGNGDRAWLRGWVRMTLQQSGQEVKFKGKYTDACRKEPDGSWRMALVIWNSDDAV